MKLIAILAMGLSLNANAGIKTDKAAIRSMSGCYKVSFDFVETFLHKKDSTFRSPEHHSGGLEWVETDRETSTMISLQHILITKAGPLKHWRQQWEYQAQDVMQYLGDLTWQTTNKKASEVSGQWVQRVYQVDDSPRYECSAPWVHWADKSYWECQTWSPLPRREFSIRSDYNVLDRRNRHEITSYGWLHEQDNGKLAVRNGQSELIAQEKGYNSYVRVDDSECQSARDWWKKNKKVWNEIQDMWSHVRSHHPNLALNGKMNGKTLWENLFEIADRYAAQASYDSKALQKEVHDAIHAYFK